MRPELREEKSTHEVLAAAVGWLLISSSHFVLDVFQWGPGNNAVNCAFITSGLTSPAAQHAIVLKNIRQTQQTAQIVSDSGLISDMARANECSVAAARELKSAASVTVGSVDPQFTLPVKRPCEKVGKYGAGHVSARSRGTSRRCVKKI